MEEKLDRLFHLKERGTTVKTEVLAGLTTFVTAAYVLVANPSVMSATGILITWALGIVCELCGLYVPDAAAGYASLLPDFSNGLAVPSFAPTFMKMDFSHIGVTCGRHSQTTRRRMPPIEKE